MKKEYKLLLWDIDDTLVDFKASEKVALEKCFQAHGISLTPEDVAVYSKINQDYWRLLEPLTSDMRGANQASIDCCWFNPAGNLNIDPTIQIDHEIKGLDEVLAIIG